MKEKIFIVISSWFYENCGYSDKNVNLVTKSKDAAIDKLEFLKKEELNLNGSRIWTDDNIFDKTEDTSDYFFISNNNGDWFEIEIIEKEID